MYKLKLKQELSLGFLKYNVLDEYDNLVYKVESKPFSIPQIVNFYNNCDMLLSQLRSCFDIYNLYEFLINDQVVETLRNTKEIFDLNYELVTNNLIVTREMWKVEFKVIDNFGHKKMKLSKENLFSLTYDIEIYDENKDNYLYYVMVVVSLLLQMSKDND